LDINLTVDAHHLNTRTRLELEALANFLSRVALRLCFGSADDTAQTLPHATARAPQAQNCCGYDQNYND
jgi:hypothetical protein